MTNPCSDFVPNEPDPETKACLRMYPPGSSFCNLQRGGATIAGMLVGVAAMFGVDRFIPDDFAVNEKMTKCWDKRLDQINSQLNQKLAACRDKINSDNIKRVEEFANYVRTEYKIDVAELKGDVRVHFVLLVTLFALVLALLVYVVTMREAT